MTTEEIYEYYRELIRRYVPKKGSVLKTDCFNESADNFQSLEGIVDPRRVTYIELDADTVMWAQDKHPTRNYVQGDIRNLPFEDGSFAVVIDMSTIDHVLVDEVPQVIREYHRVLKPNGRLVMAAWCSKEKTAETLQWEGGPQNFLYLPELLWALEVFQKRHVETFHEAGEYFMVEVVADK